MNYHREFTSYEDIEKSDNALVLRFQIEDRFWEDAVKAIKEPQGEDEFIAYVDFINDTRMLILEWNEVLELLGESYKSPVLFVVDKRYEIDRTLLVYDLLNNRADHFRLEPQYVQVVENNLSIGNLAFYEFKQQVVNGVYVETD